MKLAAAFFAILAVCVPGSGPALAHGFGQRYDLPVPLSMYVQGAAAAVAFSFAVVALFLRRGAVRTEWPAFDLLRTAPGRLLAARASILALRTVSVLVFLLVLATGFFGNQDSFRNFTPTMVWVLWWVGFAYISALLGDLWAVVNPWDAIFRGAEALWQRWRPGAMLSLNRAPPAWLGVWPGVGLFLVFAWLEMVWPGGSLPANTAAAALGYSVITWAGMFVYGRARWLQTGEAFTLVFGLLARFSMTAVRARQADGGTSEAGNRAVFDAAPPEARQWILRPWAVGLIPRRPASRSMTALVVLMLATVTFDGFRETPAWVGLAEAIMESRTGYDILWEFNARGIDPGVLLSSLGLLSAPLIFGAVYLGFCGLIRVFARSAAGPDIGTGEIARAFVPTLVPIAIAYHLAHYLSYVLTVGQYMIRLVSDPFGFGWDLFGTGAYFLSIGVVSAGTVWTLSVVAIVVAHVLAVWLAHHVALGLWRRRGPALRSQIPMMVLMVLYTMTSLWILAQPITEAG